MATRTKRPAADAPATDPHLNGSFLFTVNLAEQVRAQRDAPREFPLTATMPGAFAQVRVVDMQSPETILALPDHLTRLVLEMQRKVETLRGKGVGESNGALNTDDVLESVRMLKRAHDIYAVAGFIAPELILTEAERTKPEQVLIEDIHPADRARYFDWCQEQNGRVNQTLARFPGGPDRELVPGREDGGDEPAAERTAAAAADGGTG